jgi:hypothetical protein
VTIPFTVDKRLSLMMRITMQDKDALMPDASRLQGALDRHDIQDTISRYSLGQDAHQGEDSDVLQQWDDIFAADGKVDFSVAGVAHRLLSRVGEMDARGRSPFTLDNIRDQPGQRRAFDSMP